MNKKANRIGVTERGDPALDHSWMPWVSDGNPAILITKNCVALQNILNEYWSPNIIIHCGITGWGGTMVEPNVPRQEETLEAYKSLSERFGPERVVLRIDPIIPSELGISKAMEINSHKIGRVRISFLDGYNHIQEAFKRINIRMQRDFHAPEKLRREIWEALGQPDTCAEPGLPSTGCISSEDCRILGVEPRPLFKGQRELCACLANKFELLTRKEPCAHGCIYCYWRK